MRYSRENGVSSVSDWRRMMQNTIHLLHPPIVKSLFEIYADENPLNMSVPAN